MATLAFEIQAHFYPLYVLCPNSHRGNNLADARMSDKSESHIKLINIPAMSSILLFRYFKNR